MAVEAHASRAAPTKRIVSRAHLQVFLDSPTHADLVAFLEELNESVSTIKLSDSIAQSPAVDSLLAVLDEVEATVTATPPVDNGKSRFGNPAFKTFYDRIAVKATELHALIPGLEREDANELSVYFCESWGNRERVDYGSGMELNFICWLLCLRKLGILKVEDDKATVARVFWRYMKITRMLQTTYWLEPAGSHGAQGLDDYHFAVFIFGSSQLRGHKYIKPKAIHDNDILEEYSKDYMYLGYINYINSIKTASLRWHSPMLDDISGVSGTFRLKKNSCPLTFLPASAQVKTWDKVNSGMLKMYKAEVLAKLPVAQHFLFGSLLPYPDVRGTEDEENVNEAGVSVDEHGHLHVRGEGFGDCCGIPIPSAFAAAGAARKKEGEGKVRRIPFD
ncbi:serine/threonine-protein phosphatase 2A activator, partial [Phenoliferia sp. Uapishka_3]